MENVMIGQDGFIKLIDFGMARFLQKDQYKRTVAAFTICGTKKNIAPEMIE